MATGASAGLASESASGLWKVPRGLWRWGVRVAAMLAILAVIGMGLVPALWPFTPSVADAPKRVTAALHGGRELRVLPSPNRVGDAIIATENSRFESDFGVDVVSLARTALSTVTGSGDRGAATLEMQLAKNLYVPHTDIGSRLRQVTLAFKLDTRYSKSDILRMYLGSVYFGHRYYGLLSASQGYFGLPPEQLSWAQASLLAGLVQAPSVYDPYRRFDLAKARQRHVLDRLVATGELGRAQADAAYAAPLHLR